MHTILRLQTTKLNEKTKRLQTKGEGQRPRVKIEAFVRDSFSLFY